jgi:hypothetical protein
MDALISGQAGIAMCFDDDKTFLIEAEYPEVELSLPRDLAHDPLAGEADVIRLRSTTREKVVVYLRHAWACDRALRLTLILVDPSEEQDVKEQLPEALNDLLNDPSVQIATKTSLASIPLHFADLEAPLQMARSTEHVMSLIMWMRDRDYTVKDEPLPLVKASWPARRRGLRRSATYIRSTNSALRSNRVGRKFALSALFALILLGPATRSFEEMWNALQYPNSFSEAVNYILELDEVHRIGLITMFSISVIEWSGLIWMVVRMLGGIRILFDRIFGLNRHDADKR